MTEEKILPADWKKVKVSDVAELFRGINYTKNVASNSPSKGALPILRGNNIDGELNFDDLVYVPKTLIKPEQIIKKDDIIFAMSSGSKHLVGKSAVAKQDFEGSYGAFCAMLRVSELANKKYVSFIFKGNAYRKLISEIAKGTNINNLKREYILDFELPLPPLKTQQLIVSKIEELFSELDKGIENLKTAQQQLKTYRQAVLKWAFEGKLTNKNVKEGELPKGWKLSRLEDVGDEKYPISYGVLKPGDHDPQGVPLIQSQHIKGNTISSKIDFKVSNKLDDEYKRTKIKGEEILITLVGASIGRCAITNKDHVGFNVSRAVAVLTVKKDFFNKYILYYLINYLSEARIKASSSGSAQPVLNLSTIRDFAINYPPLQEQKSVVQKIEGYFSVSDKIEESIKQSLQQAEALRQSILTKAFEGGLITEKGEAILKPKNVYFYQMQLLGLITKESKKKGVYHGEMTIAKYAYLADRIYGIPTHYNYNRWHLGPYPKEMKKAINNKKFFKIANHTIAIVNENTLFKYSNPYKEQLINAIDKLTELFSKYKGKERSDKTELLATVCKIVEDIKTTDIKAVRKSMKEWEIKLKNTSFKNKAEKFTEEETKKCLGFIVGEGWDKKLIHC